MVWVQIIPTRETGKLESAISTWTLRLRFHPYTDPTISHWSHSMSCHLTIYQFHFHSANYLFAKVRNYIRPRLRNPPLALNFHDSTFHHSLVDFLSRLSPSPTTHRQWNHQWKSLMTLCISRIRQIPSLQ